MKKMRTISFISRKAVPLFLALCMITALMPSKLAFADANKLYVTPASSQMNLNTIFTINVRTYADSDQAAGTAVGTLTYSKDKLSVTGISVSGSGYGSPSIGQGSGTIGFNASRNPAPSGTAQLFSVTFKAVGTGTAQVGFTNDSKVNGVSTTYANGAYTINNPNPPSNNSPSPPKPPSTPKPSPVAITTTPSPTPTPQGGSVQATPDPTGLINGVAVSPLYSTSVITWKVNANSPIASLSYGLNSSQLDKQASVSRKSDGTFTTTLKDLTPGLRYAYTITATGEGGKSATYSGSIPMRGFPVTITITENDQPVQSGQVKIGNQTSLITTPGKLTIGLAAGSYSGTITTDTASLPINLTVATKSIPSDGSAPPAQSFAFNLTSSPLEQGPGSGFAILTFIGVLLGGSVLLVLGFVGFMAYRRRKFEGDNGDISYTNSPSVIIDDGYDWKSQPEPRYSEPGISSPPSHSPPVSTSTNAHNNSVYLTEEEPLDMFDQAAKDKTVVPTEPGSAPSAGTEHIPNSPRSTMP